MQQQKRTRIWLAANIKDEANIVEWCLHHARFGFEKIHILDHASKPSVRDVLAPFSNVLSDTGVQIECEVINWKLPVKMRAMNYLLEQCKKQNVDWLFYIDGDEYLSLHPRHGDSIVDLVQTAKSNFAPLAKSVVGAISIPWLMFGSNYLDKHPESNTLMDNFVRCRPTVDMHVKTIVSVLHASRAINPHYFVLQPNAVTIGTSGKKINTTLPTTLPPATSKVVAKNIVSQNYGPFNFDIPPSMTDDSVGAFLAHYANQSYERYVKRKIERARDDNSAFRGEAPDKEDFHKSFNEIVYLGMKERYSVVRLCTDDKH